MSAPISAMVRRTAARRANGGPIMRAPKRRTVLLALALIVFACAVLGVGLYIHTHHDCIDGSVGTPAQCDQVRFEQNSRDFVNAVTGK